MEIWVKDDFSVCTNKDYLNMSFIHAFLSEESYWAKGRSKDIVEKSIVNSPLCFGVFRGQPGSNQCEQIGFARVITDFATFGFLADVFIIPTYRKKGLAKWLIRLIANHDDLKKLRRFMLVTKDAHTLYKKYGFKTIDQPELFMQRLLEGD
ncbi:GNAT family N-acetyltransferase [Evansella halocellulosilytica]|uniref:GNAT family N-acetyltransferase n=1 Tax=Evansella halocellulosilytica TaxID=2011013 RepID=UPI000BB9784B|nr:GNAT family N-acetyltransferase [Evansella halocellulosilytica]